MSKYIITTRSKAELAAMYRVHPTTFRKWLKGIPDLGLQDGQRLLTPRQVQLVFEHLGEPEDG